MCGSNPFKGYLHITEKNNMFLRVWHLWTGSKHQLLNNRSKVVLVRDKTLVIFETFFEKICHVCWILYSYIYQENIMNCHLKRNYEFSIVEWSTVVSIINKIASKIHKKQFWFGLKEMYRHCCTHSKKRLFHSQWMLTKNGNHYKLFPTHGMPHIVWNHLLMFEQKCKTNVVWTSEQHLNPVALMNLENL